MSDLDSQKVVSGGPAFAPIHEFEVARHACVSRSVDRADMAATRLNFALSSLRQSEAGSPALVSVTLDEFVGNVRTAVDVCAHGKTDPSERVRIEQSLSMLNSFYASQDVNLKDGQIRSASFMPGAEFMISTVQRDMRELQGNFERDRPLPEVQRAVDRNRQLH